MKYSTTHKRVINYSTGGLGNRLRPLSSAYAVHKETGKILCQYWDSKTTNGTLAKFNELFLSFLFFSYGRHDLVDMVGKSPESLASRGSYISDNSEDNIIFYCNNFIPNTNRDFCHEFIRSLRPIPIIQEKIDKETVELGLNKNVIGVHARGTDFNVDVGYYINQMRDYGSSVTFFLSTDDVKYEKEICSIFKERVITRQGRAHLTKENEEGAWEYNFVISKEKSQDSIVDMYLLAKTYIRIYHPASTFSEIAKVLS
jgi:hypothetical protein